MRIILFTLIIIFISSCSSLDTSNIAPGYKEAYKSVKAYFFEYVAKISRFLLFIYWYFRLITNFLGKNTIMLQNENFN